MAQPRRIFLTRAVYHITARCNNQDFRFLDNEDRQKYLSLLAHYLRKHRFLLFAYCLMTNHVHLLVKQTSKIHTPDLLMHDLNGLYARWYNRKYNRKNHLWGGPYGLTLVEVHRGCDGYLLICVLYIHFNPVRARMCGRPDDYAWSSARVWNTGVEDGLVTLPESFWTLPISVYDRYNRDKCLNAYRRLVASEAPRMMQHRPELSGGIFYGREGYVASMARRFEGRLGFTRFTQPVRMPGSDAAAVLRPCRAAGMVPLVN